MENDFSHVMCDRLPRPWAYPPSCPISAAIREASCFSLCGLPSRLSPAIMRWRLASNLFSSLSAHARRQPQSMTSRSNPGVSEDTNWIYSLADMRLRTCPASEERSISGLQEPQNLSAILIGCYLAGTSSTDEERLFADPGQLLGQFLLALEAAPPLDHYLLCLG